MADNNNQASVELDTDGVNEETIHVETPTEEASAFEQKEDVDLGYTDVTNPKSAKELLHEVKKTEEKTNFTNIDDVIDFCLCSSYLPYLSGSTFSKKYKGSRYIDGDIKYDYKNENKERHIKNYITINEPASGIVKTFKMVRDTMLKLNIEPVETPSNCVRNLLNSKSKRKSKKQSKKNN